MLLFYISIIVSIKSANWRFNVSYDCDLLLFSDASLLVVQILLGFVDWTDLSEAVEPLDLLSELVDSIDSYLDVPYDSALL